MGIFGVAAPKFIYDRGGAGETTVLLDYAKIVNDEPEVRTIKHESELSGKKVFIPRGQHWNFDVVVNLYKYGDPLAAYLNFKSYQDVLVTLYRHRDGEPFKKPGGADCLFYITEVTAYAFEDIIYRDRLMLRFESSEFVDQAGSTAIVPQLSEITVITL